MGFFFRRRPSYQEIAAEKRQERDTHLVEKWLIPEDKLPTDKDVLSFPKESGLLTELELKITDSTAPVIFANIKAKIWSAVQVTQAFCHRSQIAHQLTNCLTEIFYDEALEQAKELDEHYSKTGKLKGRFHGVPISLKDNVNLMGKASTVGFVALCFDPEGGYSYESSIAQLLRREGAVFYCKTNVPTGMLMAESVNHIYGRTTNPFNRELSSGGSSGGAAAHAALGGSCIEIGSDVGGSLRIPSSFTGLYTIRPTFGRYPTYGALTALPGMESVTSVNGPMCRSVDGVQWYCENILACDCSTFDPKVTHLPWKSVELPEKLVFGWLDDDGFVRPLPPIVRGMRIVREVLEKAGHEIIDYDAQKAKHTDITNAVLECFLSDGGAHILSLTSKTKEPLFPQLKMLEKADDIPVSALWDLQTRKASLAKDYLDYWLGTCQRTKSGRPIDALLMPASAHHGCPHDKFGSYAGYTAFVNGIDITAGTVPVTRSDELLDPVDTSYSPRNDDDRFVYENYDPKKSHGGSVSVQIVCRRHEDEKLVAIMKLLNGVLHRQSIKQ